MIRELDSDDFISRQRSEEELARIGPPALPALRQEAASQKSPQVAHRLQGLIERCQSPDGSKDRLRELRAIEILEHIATDDVHTLLGELAGGDQASPLTQEAATTNARLQWHRGIVRDDRQADSHSDKGAYTWTIAVGALVIVSLALGLLRRVRDQRRTLNQH
jgi:hypothetical protein